MNKFTCPDCRQDFPSTDEVYRHAAKDHYSSSFIDLYTDGFLIALGRCELCPEVPINSFKSYVDHVGGHHRLVQRFMPLPVLREFLKLECVRDPDVTNMKDGFNDVGQGQSPLVDDILGGNDDDDSGTCQGSFDADLLRYERYCLEVEIEQKPEKLESKMSEPRDMNFDLENGDNMKILRDIAAEIDELIIPETVPSFNIDARAKRQGNEGAKNDLRTRYTNSDSSYLRQPSFETSGEEPNNWSMSKGAISREDNPWSRFNQILAEQERRAANNEKVTRLTPPAGPRKLPSKSFHGHVERDSSETSFDHVRDAPKTTIPGKRGRPKSVKNGGGESNPPKTGRKNIRKYLQKKSAVLRIKSRDSDDNTGDSEATSSDESETRVSRSIPTVGSSKRLTRQSNRTLPESGIKPARKGLRKPFGCHKFKCPECAYQADHVSSIYTHSASSHHSKQLSGLKCKGFMLDKNGCCIECPGRPISSLSQYVLHVGGKHKALKRFLSPDLVSDYDNMPSKKNYSSFNQNQLQKSLTCLLCSRAKTFANITQYKQHLCNKHYRQNIISKYKSLYPEHWSNKTCFMCGELGSSKGDQRLTTHLGSKHNFILDHADQRILDQLKPFHVVRN